MTTTMELITAFVCQVDDHLSASPTPPEAPLWPSAVGTLGLLPALTGGGNRPFSRWLARDSRVGFPRRPERPRLLRLLKTQQDWPQVGVAAPTVRGGIDTDGLAWIPPRRDGRSPQQLGRPGLSTPRGIVGGTLCLLCNQ